ncbi:Putative transcriptional regulator, ROK family protein [Sulfitobacter indolifex HEL-45]|uniref:Transcriptional regulator, ROK family protein n=1 Tax=Sulfitobacter indolifex HEL-45 TaxID=391624 RepID=A0ABM9X868_9RHOB|nr:ROK family transcriptional regulator [Sulfitobacter indolifex]EDQ05684.1 Putative transcriptional regulator, ROK family protein [Sulfitobacter indolifex HEL-45]
MRAHNERLVLSFVRRSGPTSKAEIARLTGLSAQTVSVIMRALEADGLLKKGARVRGRVGQPSVPISLNPGGAFFLGLKIGRRSVELILTDFEGQVTHHSREVYQHPTPAAVMGFATLALQNSLASLTADQQARVAGLGIALPFGMWEWEVASGDLSAWRDFDIAAALAEVVDLPIYICNDASAACGAELVFGTQDKPRDFLYFYIGYFVGGGLVLDSKLYTGKTGNAGALGSMPLAGDAPRQLVDVASLATLEAALQQAGETRRASWSDPAAWVMSEHILERWLDSAADALAQAIRMTACLIDFDTVMIDGSLPVKVRADIVARCRRHLAAQPLPGVTLPELREGTVGSDARALGAASLPLSDRFLVDRDAFLKG